MNVDSNGSLDRFIFLRTGSERRIFHARLYSQSDSFDRPKEKVRPTAAGVHLAVGSKEQIDSEEVATATPTVRGKDR